MTKMERLKQSARESAKFRGHTLGRFKSLHSKTSVADCQVCGDSVYVCIAPLPNNTDISGAAVAVNCKTSKLEQDIIAARKAARYDKSRKLCPICGIQVQLTGEITTNGRVIGSCGDAFTVSQWSN